MKKIITLVCTIACIFGLTACGSEPVYSDYEKEKLAYAKDLAAQAIVPYFMNYMDDANMAEFDEFTPEEVGYIFSQNMSIESDGYTVISAATSYNNAAETVGELKTIKTDEVTAVIDDKTIIVTVPVTGSLKDGSAEVILSNDMFMRLESAALNEVSTTEDAMIKATLNTVIGMGTVFIVLILISCIIALFGFIPKIQAKMAGNNEVKDESIDNAIAQIVEKESVDVTGDYELVAVIAAAIAASEGAASTDGFVVRSVRKVNRRR